MEEYDEFDIDVIDVVDSWEVQVVVQRRYEWTWNCYLWALFLDKSIDQKREL